MCTFYLPWEKNLECEGIMLIFELCSCQFLTKMCAVLRQLFYAENDNFVKFLCEIQVVFFFIPILKSNNNFWLNFWRKKSRWLKGLLKV